jgi:hypothetical protein
MTRGDPRERIAPQDVPGPDIWLLLLLRSLLLRGLLLRSLLLGSHSESPPREYSKVVELDYRTKTARSSTATLHASHGDHSTSRAKEVTSH